MSKSPSVLTKEFWIEKGFEVEDVECYNKFKKVKTDFGGFGDFIIYNDMWTICIQATTIDHMNEREKKIKDDMKIHKKLLKWIDNPYRRFFIQGWEYNITKESFIPKELTKFKEVLQNKEGLYFSDRLLGLGIISKDERVINA
jgi:hypothetical protein